MSFNESNNNNNNNKNNSFHQALHFLSTSKFFGNGRKLKTQTNQIEDSIFHEKNNTTSMLLSSSINKLSIELDEGFSPCTTRSNSNITISSLLSEDLLLSPIPTPSTSTDTLDLIKEEQVKPWKLSKDGSIRNDDYFFMDREDLYPINKTTNKKIIER